MAMYGCNECGTPMSIDFDDPSKVYCVECERKPTALHTKNLPEPISKQYLRELVNEQMKNITYILHHLYKDK